MLVPTEAAPGDSDRDVSLWFYTSQVDRMYQLLKSRQLQGAQVALAGGDAPGRGNPQPIEFAAEICDPPYGGREFGLRDPNGYVLYFRQDTRTAS